MIFVQGSVVMNTADLPKFRTAAVKMMEETQKEDGCLHYSFAQDVSDQQKIHICERWKDERALEEHFQTPHMAEFNALTDGWSIQSADIRIYSGEEVRVMMQS